MTNIFKCSMIALCCILFGCITTKPTQPQGDTRYTLHIYQVGNDTIRVGKVIRIGGIVKIINGYIQNGMWIYFSVTPDTLGYITEWAKTEFDSVNGLANEAVFIGKYVGTAWLRGDVMNLHNSIMTGDSFKVQILP